jgi:hypothetical protein
MVTRFEVEIERDNKIRSVEVVVYGSNEALNTAIEAYERSIGVFQRSEPVRAITHNFSATSISSRGIETPSKLVAIIRLDNTAGAAVTSHEAFHAACQLYRAYWGRPVLSDECDDREERLAHLMSDLVYAITTQLIERKVW